MLVSLRCTLEPVAKGRCEEIGTTLGDTTLYTLVVKPRKIRGK
jgi:hypothetical protein